MGKTPAKKTAEANVLKQESQGKKFSSDARPSSEHQVSKHHSCACGKALALKSSRGADFYQSAGHDLDWCLDCNVNGKKQRAEVSQDKLCSGCDLGAKMLKFTEGFNKLTYLDQDK